MLEDQEIVRVLIREQPRLLALIRLIVHNQHSAEDVLQEVVTRAIQDKAKIEDEEHLRRWLRQACRHRALNTRRDIMKRAVCIPSDILDQVEVAVDRAVGSGISEDESARLQHCLKQLPPRGRKIIELRYKEGFSCADVAGQVETSVGAIYKAMFRIRKMLHDCITMKSHRAQKQGGHHGKG